ncbi:MAG: NAD-dependent deacylase [Anaerolineales bacterium]|nr:NAD-dependent deacylase [Anaerolineales bacterium]
MSSLLTQVAQRLGRAQRVAVLTGAGMSAESGVPTFRDAQTGFWSRFKPEDLATPEAFARQPEVVWNWYAWRRELVGKAEPNPGHRALVDLATRVPALQVVTQNVDGLHQRAGLARVIELHGNLMRTICSRCGRTVETWTAEASPPRCLTCNGWLRPDVVWFGESLPHDALTQAVEIVGAAEVALVVGTSGLVEPAASLPRLALARGAFVVEINLTPTPLTPQASAFLAGPAGEVLPDLVTRLA